MAQLPVQNTPQTQPASTGQSSPGGPTGGPASPKSPSLGGSSFPFLPKPKLPPLKLPLVLVLVVLIAVALGVFFVFNKSLFQKPQPSPSPSVEDYSKPPEENLVTANGKIVSINENEKIFEISSTTPNWDKKWKAKVGEKTVLADEDWFSPKGVSKDKLQSITAEELAQIVPKLKFSDYRVGDTVYLTAASGQDLTKELGVFEPF